MPGGGGVAFVVHVQRVVCKAAVEPSVFQAIGVILFHSAHHAVLASYGKVVETHEVVAVIGQIGVKITIGGDGLYGIAVLYY
jgi:hypothetical protein